MKKITLHFLAIAIGFTISCYAQHSENLLASAKIDNMPSFSDSMSDISTSAIGGEDKDLVVVAYHVEERIDSKFGSQITTYNVTDVKLIAKNDLGPDNTRTITPIYGKNTAKPKVEVEAVAGNAATSTFNMKLDSPKASFIDTRANAVVIKEKAKAPPVEAKPEPVAVDKNGGYVNIDLIATYERILEKGYKSADMLKRVANARFFEGSLEASAKWYKILFSMTNDLEPVYYYRYAESLKSIKDVAKAKEMMDIFEKRTL